MRTRVIAGSLLVSFLALNPIVNHAQSADRLAVCNGKIADAYCKALSNEFAAHSILNSTYGLTDLLYQPTSQPTLFIPAIQKQIFDDYLKQDLHTIGTNTLQTIANFVGQSASTKAVVPQTGANPSSSASTTLVQKPTTTDIISLAAESGAFTDTVNGNAITATTNVNGLRRYLSSKPFALARIEDRTTADILQHITLSSTFNVAQSGSAAVPTTGQATPITPSSIAPVILPSNNVSFNSLDISWQILRRYTPTNNKFVQSWNSQLDDATVKANIVTASRQLFTDYLAAIPNFSKLYSDPEVLAAQNTWINEAKTVEQPGGTFETFVDDFVKYFNVVVNSLEKNKNFDQSLLAAATDISTLQSIRSNALDKARGTIATLKYEYATPTQQPSTHQATAILAYTAQTTNKGAQINANFAGTWFASVPSGAKYGRLKSYQISAEYDQPFGNRDSPRAILSAAGYGQYQYAPNVLNVTVANTVPGTNIAVPSGSQVFTSTAGWLGIAQTKLTFNIGKGATIPIAVKWSNKTNLLTGSDWKGQFGFSYDLSALQSILTPK